MLCARAPPYSDEKIGFSAWINEVIAGGGLLVNGREETYFVLRQQCISIVALTDALPQAECCSLGVY